MSELKQTLFRLNDADRKIIEETLKEKDDKIKQLEAKLAELKEKYNKASEKLKNITEEVENNFVHGQDYEKLKQELAELKEKDNYHLRYELAGADETITNLKQQLAEKQNTIDEINRKFVQAVHDWKTLCAEKDKEIERLKVFEKAYYFNQTQVSQESMDLLLQNAYQVHNETQLAIQELEKAKDLIKHFCEIHSDEFYGVKSQVKGIEQNVYESIDNQIKILKGE